MTIDPTAEYMMDSEYVIDDGTDANTDAGAARMQRRNEIVRMQRRNEIVRAWDEANQPVKAQIPAARRDRRAQRALSAEFQYNRELAEEALRELDYEVIGENGVTTVIDLRDPRQVLQAIAWWEQCRSDAEEQVSIHTGRRDELIPAAMAADPPLPCAAIAQAARVSEPRLYQIRDGRR
ncbi:hypothetical protein QTQ03_25230 [Micromonospora sp. WMMA1363]|uniref:hypothetical protein n=1 Tax=Micromonospora sp. WMMA1363 TaxID=3053985 RepID=UPI00259C92FF|nr:hypothetical protein [Micromonospora sp. WMMA1363]MDM4722738.1 hypothetical protein [Micromonospora sp. WMMA1363]